MARYGEASFGASTIYVGIDVHRRHWHVTVRTFERELWQGSIVASWDILVKVLQRYTGSKMSVVYEAGYSGFWLYDRLVSWGVECLVTPPSLIPSDYGNRVKTDRIDSRKLAFLLSRQLLKSVWVPDAEARRHRQVLRRRHQLVLDRRRLQCRIKSEAACFGLELPDIRGRWTVTFEQHLWQLRFGDRWQTESFQRLLKAYQMVSELIAEQTKLLKELSATERYRTPLAHLTTVPGVGLMTGMEVLLELGDLRRFRRSNQLAAYVGLTPSQYSSGERVRMGRITGIGKPRLRANLIEAAWMLIRRDDGQKRRYQQLQSRCGAKRAIVAIARRLLLTLRRLVLDQQNYQPASAV